MKFDDVLHQIGGFGRFQKTLYVWICLPQILLAFHMFVSIFTGAVPPHLCLSTTTTWPSPANQESGTDPSWSSGSSSIPSFNFSQVELACPAAGGASQQANGVGNYSGQLDGELQGGGATGECKGGWEYSREIFSSTIVTEWDLVCDDAKLNNIGSFIYMFGLLVGAVLFGTLADKYGRRTIILVGLALQALFGVGAAFAPTFYIYTMLRFVVGTTISAVIMNAFVLGTEWTGPKQRMLAGIITDYFFGVGYILLALLAYLIRDWRQLQLAISAPGFVFVFYFWVLPKSARWLLANRKHEEAMDLIQKAALVNGRPLGHDIELEQDQNIDKTLEKQRKHTVLDLVRTPKMRTQSLIVFYLWFVNVLVYYGLSLNISDFGINIYLTQFIFGLVEMPARTITLFTLNRSRRISQLAFLAVGGLACLLTIFIPDDLSMVRTGLAMVGKFGITASLSIIYVYSAEVFPTVVRQSGIGMGSMCARAGGAIAPIIYLLKRQSPKAPMVLFGLCPLVGAALTLLLPETANMALPDTIEEVERAGQSSSNEKGTSCA